MTRQSTPRSKYSSPVERCLKKQRVPRIKISKISGFARLRPSRSTGRGGNTDSNGDTVGSPAPKAILDRPVASDRTSRTTFMVFSSADPSTAGAATSVVSQEIPIPIAKETAKIFPIFIFATEPRSLLDTSHITIVFVDVAGSWHQNRCRRTASANGTCCNASTARRRRAGRCRTNATFAILQCSSK